MNCPDEEEKFAQLCNVLLAELAANVSELPTLATFAKDFFLLSISWMLPPQTASKIMSDCQLYGCLNVSQSIIFVNQRKKALLFFFL